MSRESPPRPRSSSSTSVYRDGSTTTPTDSKFFAAARTIAGPPMSIFSITSSDAGAGGDRLAERVQVHDDEVERLDPVLGQLREVLGFALVGEQPTVDPWVQRLHSAVEHLGESRHLLDGGDLQPGFAQGRRGPPRGHERDTHLGESPGRARPRPSCRRPRAELVAPHGRPSRRSSVDRHLAAVDADAPLDEGGGRSRQEAVLDLVHASLQRIPVIVLAHLDGFLQDDGPVSIPSSTRNTVTPVTLHTVGECVGDAAACRGRPGRSDGCTFSQRPP